MAVRPLIYELRAARANQAVPRATIARLTIADDGGEILRIVGNVVNVFSYVSRFGVRSKHRNGLEEET